MKVCVHGEGPGAGVRGGGGECGRSKILESWWVVDLTGGVLLFGERNLGASLGWLAGWLVSRIGLVVQHSAAQHSTVVALRDEEECDAFSAARLG